MMTNFEDKAGTAAVTTQGQMVWRNCAMSRAIRSRIYTATRNLRGSLQQSQADSVFCVNAACLFPRLTTGSRRSQVGLNH